MTLDEVPGGLVIVQAAVVFLSFTFTLLILFFPVWWRIKPLLLYLLLIIIINDY